MCLPTDAVTDLHAVTSELKQTQADREGWLLQAGDGDYNELYVTRAEGERIFAARIGALESRLKDLGWTRVVRVEPAQDRPAQPANV